MANIKQKNEIRVTALLGPYFHSVKVTTGPEFVGVLGCLSVGTITVVAAVCFSDLSANVDLALTIPSLITAMGAVFLLFIGLHKHQADILTFYLLIQAISLIGLIIDLVSTSLKLATLQTFEYAIKLGLVLLTTMLYLWLLGATCAAYDLFRCRGQARAYWAAYREQRAKPKASPEIPGMVVCNPEAPVHPS